MQTQLAKNLALNLAAGGATFFCVLLVALGMHTIHRLPIFLLGVAALLYLAGYLRAFAPPLQPIYNGVTVSLGASIPVLLLGRAVGLVTFGWRSLALVICLAAICAGAAQARRWWRAGSQSVSQPESHSGWQSGWRTGQSLAASALTLAIFAAVFLGSRFALPVIMASGSNQSIDQPAPPFALTMLDGTPVSLASLKGRVVVLSFWGTWCAPCLAELPDLDSVYARYRSNPDVVFLLVNSGLNGDNPGKVRSFTDKHHLQIPVTLDTTEAADTLGAKLLPALLILDRQGHIRMQNSGYQGADALRRTLTQEVEVLLH